MASLLPKNGTILNYAAQAPSPQKDFCQIIVKNHQVVFRWWKLTIRKNAKNAPGQILDTYEDFSHDERAHSEIHRVFGPNMLEYVKNLVAGHIDYFPRMPKDLLIQIIRYLPLESVKQLSYTSKMFHELCNSDELWEEIYHDHLEQPITEELRSLAEALGWKQLFFTNQLQLRVKLRRQAKKIAKAGDVAFVTQKMDDMGTGDY